MMFGLFIVFKYPPINCHSALIWQSLSRAVSPWGRRTSFFWHPVLPHKCGVPPDYGTPHLCGSEEFCRAPDLLRRISFFVQGSGAIPRIPKGFRLKAQSCPEPSGLLWGSVHPRSSTPTRLRLVAPDGRARTSHNRVGVA